MFGKFVLVVAMLAAAGCATPNAAASDDASPRFVYDDFDRFGAALQAIDAGEAPAAAFATYIAGASPAFPFYAERYGVTAEALAAAIARRPRHYRQVAALKRRLQAFEPVIARGVSRLGDLVGDRDPAPIYFIVAHMVAGGTPTELRPRPPGQPEYGIAIAVETVSRTAESDAAEFSAPYGGAYLADIPYTAIHESVHIHQIRAQGIDNYRSIYRPGPNNTYLALAVREGCADYLTFLVAGLRRTGNQHSWGLAHERDLWQRFQGVMDRPASFGDGWFGALDPRTPDWPPQIGYWLGMRICEAHHRDAADPAAALREIFSAYRAEDVRRMAQAYIRRMGD